ncbi:sigma-70 family RNA polymerase sigma factor [Paractinoplanes rishiriensis]|uniref:sigma-70 family RNA polymerase sigma factor n=1 Tax=Paractinoplanes rishiriensis TaxID=1050105 RepID=UPI001EF235FD|nr:sigma-70 family RNA polymerase sigma factor [Actinoplanes rishiriensis]
MTQSQVTPDAARLVRAAQAGRPGALDELVAEHLPLVYNVVGRALAGHPDADDVVQETMIRAIRGLPALREPERFRSWLISIAYRQIAVYLRSRRVASRRRVSDPVELPDPRADFAESATAGLVVSDQRRELVAAARWLDDSDRRLLGLWWQEASGELTRSELAAAIRVDSMHAAVRVRRMKAQLDIARGIVRALRARPRCPDLTRQLRRWNGVADPLWRKRLARHVRSCEICTATRAGLVAPEELLFGMAALPVPIALAAGIKAAAPVKAGLFGLMNNKTVTVAAATTAAVGGGFVYAVSHESLPPGSDTVVVAPTVVRTAAPGTAGRAPGATANTPTSRPVLGLGVRSADIYVAPTGSDDGDGSAGKPYATIAKAASVVRPGQTIALRGGTYRPAAATEITTSGTAEQRIVLSNYRGEQPVIDASALPDGSAAVTQRTAYWTVQGLEMTGAPNHAYVCRGCQNTIFRNLAMHGNGRSGLLLRDPGTTGNQVLDSDFYDNRDPGGSARVGVGLGIQFGSGTGNLVRGNRAYGNGSVGFEFGEFGSPVTVENNWAWGNNDGFVTAAGLSEVAAPHVLRNNAAWDNRRTGFSDDQGAEAATQMINNTAYRNGEDGFGVGDMPGVLRDNVSVDNVDYDVQASDGAQQSGNSWQRGGWSAASFRSTDPASAIGPRRPDGSLPRTDFLRTTNGVGAVLSD